MTKDSDGPVTLKTIAAEMGVSVTTVARALKDGHKISPEMVLKVRETAARMGYVRNLDGARLRTGRTFVIMAFLGFQPEEEVGDSGAVGLLNGIHQRLVGTEYALRAVPVGQGAAGLDAVRQVVRARQADGIILDHTELLDARVKYLLEADFPFVTFGRTELLSEHPWFDIDNEQAAHQGTEALLRDGFRRIALIDGEPRFTFVRQRLRGYEQALRDHGIAPDPALRHLGELAPDTARRAAGPLLDAGADAFLCANELALLGAQAGTRDRLGAKAGAVGFAQRSGTRLGDYIAAPVHSAHFSRRMAGARLADLLLRRIEGAAPAECQELAQTTLISTGG
ncbi:LacI family DNA-binding transcriptional regulator [Paracoccus xiamenensis]|uniref:LacI family DNA-binding transcriptional regulator n=1 Tax=Paracoccus xiamenensis TaxID=2714901 RepID=UPI001408DF5F|nr:LacI family DNA-binding transcriptional regulator [Paracoccus xiamenensis]NHF73233.1 LacI family transcriptional regulator [Paracoccus xiamenensis]